MTQETSVLETRSFIPTHLNRRATRLRRQRLGPIGTALAAQHLGYFHSATVGEHKTRELTRARAALLQKASLIPSFSRLLGILVAIAIIIALAWHGRSSTWSIFCTMIMLAGSIGLRFEHIERRQLVRDEARNLGWVEHFLCDRSKQLICPKVLELAESLERYFRAHNVSCTITIEVLGNDPILWVSGHGWRERYAIAVWEHHEDKHPLIARVW